MALATLTQPGVLAVVFALLFVTTFQTLLSVRRRLAEQVGQAHRLAELVDELRREPTPDDHASAPDRGVADLARLEAELDGVNRQLEQLLQASLNQHKISGARSLTEAVGGARSGQAADDIARACGLSIGEAELLVRLHGPQARH